MEDFTPEIGDDAVCYRIYFPQPSVQQSGFTSNSEERAAKGEGVALDERLAACQGYASALATSAGHIWQHEPFQLRSIACGESSLSYLEGRTCFGDNVEDEWLIVYILFQLSKQYEEACVEVWDNDGQFLLIEAALCLPKWIAPENSKHRVWICRGRLHVVPPNIWSSCIEKLYEGFDSDDDGASRVHLDKVLQCVSASGVDTLAPTSLEDVILARIQKFPLFLQSQLHTFKVRTPLAVLRCLQQNPQLISAAIQAFYTRDAIDIKNAAPMTHFPATTVVTASVTATRCLYAQLRRQRFKCPSSFEGMMPPSSAPEYVAAELGMKLAVGFEMLAVAAAKRRVKAVPSAPSEDVTSLPQWKQFHRTLVSLGYFEGTGPGSRAYANKLSAAVSHFKQSLAYSNSGSDVDPDSDARVAAENEVWSSLQAGGPGSLEEIGWVNLPDTDSSWMDATEAELERELQKRERELAAMTGQPTSPDGAGVFGTFEAFINSASGYGGVGHDNGSEFFDSDDGSSCGDSNDEAAPQATRTSCKIVLDPERFLQILSGQYGTGKVVGTSAIPADEGCQKPAGAAPPTQRVFRTERVESRASDTSDMMNSSGEDDEDDEPSVSDYMAAMDAQLRNTKLAQSFVTAADITSEVPETYDDGEHGDEAGRVEQSQLDDAVNFLSSAMESVASQAGAAGPLTNIFGDLGVTLPTEWRQPHHEDGDDAVGED